MTTTGLCEMSGPSLKFSGVGSKFFMFYICLIVQAQFVYRGRFEVEEEASQEVLCHGNGLT